MFLLTDVEGLGSQNLGGVPQLAETGKVDHSAICESTRDMTNVGLKELWREKHQPLNNTLQRSRSLRVGYNYCLL
jgi:hypothetical protein